MNKRIHFIFLLFVCLGVNLHAQQAITVFDLSNSPLPDNQCRYIAIDSVGKKWIGTTYGLAVYNDTTWQVYTTLTSGISGNTINHITFDHQGRVWISTASGVSVFDGSTWIVYTKANTGNGLSSDYVRTVTIDRFDHAWIGTSGGLDYFDGTTWTSYDILNSSIPVNVISGIFIESDSIRWIATINGGFAKMTDTSFIYWSSFNHGFPDNSVLDMRRDTDGTFWLASPSNGLIHFHNGVWVTENTTNSFIPGNSLSSITIDSLENFYIGSYGAGILKRTNGNYVRWDTTSGIPDENIFTVALERNGLIWAGTESHGLVRFDENLWNSIAEQSQTSFSIYPNPFSDHVTLTSLENIRGIRVTDVAGSVIYSREMGNSLPKNLTVDLPALSPGIYFLSADLGNAIVTKKLFRLK